MKKEEKEILQSQLNREKQLVADLKYIFGQAQDDVVNKIIDLSRRKDMENLQTIIFQKQYQEVLRTQLDAAIDMLQANEYTTIQEYLNDCYTSGYTAAMYEVAKSSEVPIIVPIDTKAVTKAIQIDSKLSKTLYKSLDMSELKKSVRMEVSRGILNGSSWLDIGAKIGKNIKGSAFQKPLNYGIRIARTEGHRIQVASAMDAQAEAKKKGADVVKQWSATLDSETRPTHQELDGQIRETDEDFEFSGGKVSAPGMFGSPAEDCNCRCRLNTRARWSLTEEELEKLKERAAFFGLDKTKDFDDFREKYLKSFVEREFKTLSIEEFKKMRHTVTKEERKILYGKSHFSGYINSSNARLMNGELRNGKTLNKEYQKIADTLSAVIQKNSISQDIVVTRYVSADALESITEYKYPRIGLLASKNDIETYWNTIESIPSQIKKGHKYKEKGFLSTSGVIDKNVMQDKQIRLNIKVPKGTNGYVTTNNKESEIIFDRGTCIEILSAKVENNRTSKVKIILDCIMR